MGENPIKVIRCCYFGVDVLTDVYSDRVVVHVGEPAGGVRLITLMKAHTSPAMLVKESEVN